ncbi:hypothetical protein ES288_A01G022400v1 [Gossypium darwinii]|uniref:Uncharacterized protein n=1 Tax=Gossypium darwinii TaxID=34276 RepID=A0A5D2HIQ4_GOSDA|nr:hypothetical protein ES288_A01G022400v1 [Gossypium darwinii]
MKVGNLRALMRKLKASLRYYVKGSLHCCWMIYGNGLISQELGYLFQHKKMALKSFSQLVVLTCAVKCNRTWIIISECNVYHQEKLSNCSRRRLAQKPFKCIQIFAS